MALLCFCLFANKLFYTIELFADFNKRKKASTKRIISPWEMRLLKDPLDSNLKKKESTSLLLDLV